MTDQSPWEKIIRDLLRARVCIEGVAKDPDEAYRILAADLEAMCSSRGAT